MDKTAPRFNCCRCSTGGKECIDITYNIDTDEDTKDDDFIGLSFNTTSNTTDTTDTKNNAIWIHGREPTSLTSSCSSLSSSFSCMAGSKRRMSTSLNLGKVMNSCSRKDNSGSSHRYQYCYPNQQLEQCSSGMSRGRKKKNSIDNLCYYYYRRRLLLLHIPHRKQQHFKKGQRRKAMIPFHFKLRMSNFIFITVLLLTTFLSPSFSTSLVNDKDDKTDTDTSSSGSSSITTTDNNNNNMNVKNVKNQSKNNHMKKKKDERTKNNSHHDSHHNTMSSPSLSASLQSSKDHPVPYPVKYPSSSSSYSSSSSSSSSNNDTPSSSLSSSATASTSTSATVSSSSSSTTTTTTTTTTTSRNKKRYKAFLKWCQTTLGIQTLLEIKDFEYINHFHEWKYNLKVQNEYISGDNKDHKEDVDDDIDEGPKKIIVRGLAATRDIEMNEVLISVPYHALFTIHTTIDHDPVLSQIIGPQARSKYGWDLSSTGGNGRSGGGGNDDGTSASLSANGSTEKIMETTLSPVSSSLLPSSKSRPSSSSKTTLDNEETSSLNNYKSEMKNNNNDNDDKNNKSNTNHQDEKNDMKIDPKEILNQRLNQEYITSNLLNSNKKKSNINNISATKNTYSNDSTYYEIGLLTVALLYHRSLGQLSPIWFQIDTLLDSSSTSGESNIPILWNNERLKNEFDGVLYGPTGDEVRRLVLALKRDVKDMYDEIMTVLIQNHGDIFGKPKSSSNSSGGVVDDGNIVVDNDDLDETTAIPQEWMFSFEKFEWAFAMVNSRKWHLPLADLDENALQDDNGDRDDVYDYDDNTVSTHYNTVHTEIPDPAAGHESRSSASVNSMPAQQPTDEYMSLQDEAIRLEYSEEETSPRPALYPQSKKKRYNNIKSSSNSIKHSFMAPLADMLNFGPPCAKGRYNTESKAFEVIATCTFLQGQEVTFWYSDDCESVMIANYGFAHPMIPPCVSAEAWENRSEVWKSYAQSLEKTLVQAYEELYDALQELKDCNGYDDKLGNDNKIVGNEDVDAGTATLRDQDVKLKDRENSNVQNNNGEEDGHSGIRRTRQRDHDDIGL